MQGQVKYKNKYAENGFLFFYFQDGRQSFEKYEQPLVFHSSTHVIN